MIVFICKIKIYLISIYKLYKMIKDTYGKHKKTQKKNK